MKTLYLQEMFQNGIFILGTHNVSYSHSKEDVENLLKAYESFFAKIHNANGFSIGDLLKSEEIKPLFKIR